MSQAPDQLREKRVELILQQLEELPTLPAVAIRLLEVTAKESSSAKEVVELLESDPALATRLLQLVHRADAGVRGEVATVDRAVLLLGFEAVRAAVLAVSVFQTMAGDGKPGEGHFSREEFWKHSVAVACCAELLAEALTLVWGKDAGVDSSVAFTAGLLHDLGKVALDAALPKSFSRVVEAADLLRGNIADVERTVIGLDHMVVGKRLAERWKLPVELRDCIWLHGQLPAALPATVKSPRLVNLVTLADLLVREQHLGYSGNYTFHLPKQSLIEAIGLTPEHVAKAMSQLVSHIEPRAKALGLGQSTSNELYHQALSQANKELGRVSGQLAAKNRRLAIRAKFFDALAGFQAELQPDAGSQVVLQAVGQTAISVLDVTVCGAFSIAPGAGFAETLLFDQQGLVFDNTLIDCPKRPPVPPAGEGPVLAVGDDMDWLISAISPRLPFDQRYWVCLEADGVCIGGVFWGAPIGEAQRLSTQTQEILAISSGWSLALRMAQIREEARSLAEQLAEANRKLHTANEEIHRGKMMISVGEMAAGAAHEMNNPLAVISGRSQLLASQLTDPKQKAAAKQVADQADRLSEIITELMDFAKPTPPKPREVDLADLVDRAIHEAKQHLEMADRKVEITMGDIPPVAVDPEQVGAALQAVVDNAINATDARTGQISVHAAYDQYSQRVVLAIADNGCGMDDHTLKHAFDPFFSSRPAGRRRGMGLAKAMRWIESSSGSIRLESRPNHGTRSVILLPAAPISMPVRASDAKTAT
jgi:putative nucleotidyltransferase with HDIG domain